MDEVFVAIEDKDLAAEFAAKLIDGLVAFDVRFHEGMMSWRFYVSVTDRRPAAAALLEATEARDRA